MPDTTTAANTHDWTAIDGRTNSAPEYLALIDAVDTIIRGCSHALIGGRSRAVAGMIMAQLAHQHGLTPATRNAEPANAELGDTARDLLKGLTVAQLRVALADLPDDMPVIVYGEHGQDGESPASGVKQVWYRPQSTWGGEVNPTGAYTDGTRHDPDPTAEARAVFIEPIN